jgi:hypothetical protein
MQYERWVGPSCGVTCLPFAGMGDDGPAVEAGASGCACACAATGPESSGLGAVLAPAPAFCFDLLEVLPRFFLPILSVCVLRGETPSEWGKGDIREGG